MCIFILKVKDCWRVNKNNSPVGMSISLLRASQLPVDSLQLFSYEAL